MMNFKYIIGLLFLSFNFFLISCDDEPIDPALLLDNTVSECASPLTFSAGNFVENTVKLSWNAAQGTDSWVIQYGLEGFVLGSGTMVAADNVSELTISNLTTTNEYSFYIRTVCSDNTLSNWVGPIAVGTSAVICQVPTSVTAVRSLTNTSEITVSWTSATTTGLWEVQYGNTGFIVGTGTVTSSTVPTKTINGLLATSAYDFYVRKKCDATQNSGWAGPIHVVPAGTTPPGLVDYAFMNATIDGVSYTSMKPYLYMMAGTDANIDNLDGDEGRVLWIQGDTSPMSVPPTGIEINIRIHEDFWQPDGPHTLYSGNSSESTRVNLINQLNDNPVATDESEIDGTFTILEFNSVTRRIRGTFSFTYTEVNEDGVGPVKSVTGTFDNPVPAEAF